MGLAPEDLGVSPEILETDYLLQVAYLDPASRPSVEQSFIEPFLEVHHSSPIPTVKDYREVASLEVKPPDVYRYFARARKEMLADFVTENHLTGIDPRRSEDEFIFQNSFRLNQQYYASLGEDRKSVV